jgi:hypothetical protein
MAHIANYDATLAARYGIVQPFAPADNRLALLGLRSSNANAITVRSRRHELTDVEKRRVCRMACGKIGARRPRFNSTRTAMLERSLARHASRPNAA